MGGATVPTPGGSAGAMAFPSASEPNPILQGLRGTGPEQIINQPQTPQAPPTSAPSPGSPAATTPSPFTGPQLYQFQNPSGTSPLLYALQGGLGQLITPNYGSPYFQEPNLTQYGYTDISQVPQLGNILDSTYNGNPLVGGVQYTFGTGQPGTGFGPASSFSYNTQAPAFQNYQPLYNPISPSQYSQAYANYINSPGAVSQSGIITPQQVLGSALQPYGSKSNQQVGS